MAKQQSEYQKIVQNGPELRVAFQDHLVGLCEILLGVHLITSDNVSVVMNEATGLPARASKLLELIRNKVKPNSENYYVFVKAIQKDKKGRFRQEYRDILDILGEECPKPQSQLTTSPPARPRTPTFLHFMESDVIQNHCADLTLAISASDSNIQLFGSFMVQYKCFTQEAVTSIKTTMGISNFDKAGRLITLIDSRIKSSGSEKNARRLFDCFMFVLEHKLKLPGSADALATTLKKKDPLYQIPLPTFDEQCAQNSVEETGKPKDNSEVVPNTKQAGDSERSSDQYYAQEEDPDAPSTHVTGDKPKDNGDKPKDNGEGAKETESQQGELERSSSKGSNISSPMQVSEDQDDHVGAMHPATECEDGGAMQPAAYCGGDGRVESDSAPVIAKPNETLPKKDVATPSQPSQPGAGAGAESCAAVQKYLNPAGGETKSKGIAFSEDMSEKEFKEFLISRGLCLQDCETIATNGFTAKGFAQNLFSEEEINCTELNFTRGGKKALRKLLKEIEQ